MSQVYKIEFNETVKGPAGEIQPGVYWISKGDMPNFLSAAKPGTWEILDMLAVFPDYWKKSKNKDIIIIRPGGFGDLLFLNPLLLKVDDVAIAVTLFCELSKLSITFRSSIASATAIFQGCPFISFPLQIKSPPRDIQ